MGNDEINRDSQSALTNAGEGSSASVPVRVGRNTVQIDTSALRRLIDTLRAKLLSES